VTSFGLLGPLAVVADGRPVDLAARKPRALLVLLLLDPNRLVASERLIEALWDGQPPATAQKALQVYVSQLRRVLGRDRLETVRSGYRIRVEKDELDLLEFQALRQAGRLQEALALWRGPALADLLDEPFAQAESRRLEELRLACLETRIESDLDHGRHLDLVPELEALVLEHPLRERFRSRLMLALYRSGRQADALRCYQEARRELVDILGIEPGDELQELQRRILNHDPGLLRDDPYQHELPEARLPAPATELVGRAIELDEVTALIHTHRLVTISGAGGSGKTRLALEVASKLSGEFDRVYFVSLGALREPDAVAVALADGLGVAVAEETDPLDAVGHALAGHRAMLVLDNFEQLVVAAPVVAELIAACPLLNVLVTSRASLHLSSEHEYPLSPLSLADASALFLEEARSKRRTFDASPAALAEICTRLDCLPLAIELAAARARVLSADELLARLGHRLELLTGGASDLEARQRTLRTAIEWSFALLDPDEQRTFTRLSVFSGGCTLAAAENVCGATLGQLESLVDKNLVAVSDQFGETRFSMLETIREFALEELEATGAVEGVCDSFADYYLVLAREQVSQVDQGDLAALTALERELDNFLAAFAWSHAPDSVPAPTDDGSCDHLAGLAIPHLTLDSSRGPVDLAEIGQQLLVLYIYPGTTRPGRPPLPGLYETPGGRGCTAENRGYRSIADHFNTLGATVAGLSAQPLEHQLAFAQQGAMPYPIIADPDRHLARELGLPTFDVAGTTLYKRVTLVVERGTITKAFYPVFPPNKNADEVAAWLATDQTNNAQTQTGPQPATA
jgi:predicted ATPase/DNA-binding SARP family transcriptional activator/peroxiredoxin